MAYESRADGAVIRLRSASPLAAAYALLGCAALSAQDDVPALIEAPSAASHAELARVVSEALGGAPVTLANDALVHDDVLIIERGRLLDPAGRRIEGRALDAPERFRLVISGSRCVLVREADGARFGLRDTQCRASSARR